MIILFPVSFVCLNGSDGNQIYCDMFISNAFLAIVWDLGIRKTSLLFIERLSRATPTNKDTRLVASLLKTGIGFTE